MQSVLAIGEEFGWRGWLATRAASWGFWPLAFVSGLVWIVWHLPVLAVIGDRPLWDIVIYFAGMLPWAPLLLALRWRSGSVWPAVLTHGAINSVRVYLLQSVPDAQDHLLIEVIGWVLTLAAAAWLMRPSRMSDLLLRTLDAVGMGFTPERQDVTKRRGAESASTQWQPLTRPIADLLRPIRSRPPR